MFGFEYAAAAVLVGPAAVAGPEQQMAYRRGRLGSSTFGKDPGAEGIPVRSWGGPEANSAGGVGVGGAADVRLLKTIYTPVGKTLGPLRTEEIPSEIRMGSDEHLTSGEKQENV